MRGLLIILVAMILLSIVAFGGPASLIPQVVRDKVQEKHQKIIDERRAETEKELQQQRQAAVVQEFRAPQSKELPMRAGRHFVSIASIAEEDRRFFRIYRPNIEHLDRAADMCPTGTRFSGEIEYEAGSIGQLINDDIYRFDDTATVTVRTTLSCVDIEK